MEFSAFYWLRLVDVAREQCLESHQAGNAELAGAWAAMAFHLAGEFDASAQAALWPGEPILGVWRRCRAPLQIPAPSAPQKRPAASSAPGRALPGQLQLALASIA